ncbi:MAG TPA: hypothetical protein VMR96_01120 [Solirubrobacterales bacterium]|nr:hypothetical protein [Solirubrobacterales bacterium]
MKDANESVDAIVAQQKEDFVAYLARVKGLPAPTRDLVFMHSEAAVASGLEAATSERLAVMARNGQTEGLATLLEELPEAQRVAAVANLARWAGSFALIPEQKNAITVLLAATAAVDGLDPTTTALSATAVLAAPGEPPPGALGDVVALARRCKGPQRRQLIERLKTRQGVTSDTSACAALIESFPELEDADDLYGDAMGMAIGQIDETATKRLLELPEEDQARLLDLADPTIERWLQEAREKASNPPEGEEPSDTSAVNGWLHPALRITEGSPPALTRFSIWLLRAGNESSDLEVEHRLDELAPVQNPDLHRLLLGRMQHRPLAEREKWLEAIEPETIDENAAAALDEVARQLWIERTGTDADPEASGPILEGLGALVQGLPEEARVFPALEAAIDTSCEAPMDNEATVEERLVVSEAAKGFVERELADTTRAADRFVTSAAAAMGPLPNGELAQAPNLRGAARQLQVEWLKDASLTALDSLRAAALQDASAQLDATKAEALLRATGRAAELGGGEAEAPLGAEAIGILARDYGEAADGAVEAWLTYFGRGEDIWSALGPSWERPLSPSLRQVFAKQAKALSKKDQQDLVEAAIDCSLAEHAPPADNWEAVALREVGGGWLVRALAARRPDDGDLERWRTLLEIARQRTLSSRAKPLVASELLRPLIEEGTDEAVELALDNIRLTGRQGAEQMLKEVEMSVAQQGMAEEKLKAMGWRKGVLSGILHALTGAEESATPSEEREED